MVVEKNNRLQMVQRYLLLDPDAVLAGRATGLASIMKVIIYIVCDRFE
jgi:hypothetical protein